MVKKTKKDTKSAILDAAEHMMAEHGIKGTSLRAILGEAGANTAALHYHFGSREALVHAILARRGQANSARRLEMLRVLQSRDEKPTVSDLVDAMIDPMLQMLEEDGEAGRRFLRFLARLQSDRTNIHHDTDARHFPEVRQLMAAMFQEACPHLSLEDLQRRLTMALDTILQSLANADFMAEEWSEGSPGDLLADFSTTLKDYLVGGLSAPSRSTTPAP